MSTQRTLLAQPNIQKNTDEEKNKLNETLFKEQEQISNTKNQKKEIPEIRNAFKIVKQVQAERNFFDSLNKIFKPQQQTFLNSPPRTTFEIPKLQLSKEDTPVINQEFDNVLLQPLTSVELFRKQNPKSERAKSEDDLPIIKDFDIFDKNEILIQKFENKIKKMMDHNPLKFIVQQRIIGIQNDALVQKALGNNQEIKAQNILYKSTKALTEILDIIFSFKQRIIDSVDTEVIKLKKEQQRDRFLKVKQDLKNDDIFLNPLQFKEEEEDFNTQVKINQSDRDIEKKLRQKITNEVLESIFQTNMKFQEKKESEYKEFLSGIDTKECLFEFENTKILFDQKKINHIQNQLHKLVGKPSEDSVTFLTQTFPDAQVQFHQQDYIYFANKMKKIIENTTEKKEIDQKKLAENLKKINFSHSNRRKVFEQICSQIVIEEEAIAYKIVRYGLCSSERQAYLFFAFLEACRQVTVFNRPLASILVKLFSEYFLATKQEVRNVGSFIGNQCEKLMVGVQELIKFADIQLTNHLSQDQNSYKLKADFEKLMSVMEVASAHLQKQEKELIDLRLKIDILQTNINLIFPNGKNYISQILQAKDVEEKSLMKNQEEIEANLKQQDKMLQKLKLNLIRKYKITSLNYAFNDQTSGEIVTSYDMYKKPLGEEIKEKNQKYHEQAKYLKMYEMKKKQLDEQSDSDLGEDSDIFKWILEDIERLLGVIPLKTKTQELFEKEQRKREHLELRLKMQEKMHQQDEQSKQGMMKALDEYAKKAANAEQDQIQKFYSLEEQLRTAQEKLIKLQNELDQFKSFKKVEEKGVQTIVDSELEKILQQEEFNIQLVKYRKVNCGLDYKQVIKPEINEQLSQPNQQYLLSLQIQQALKNIRDGSSKYIQEVKSLKSILKMIGNFIQSKINVMQNKLVDKHAYDSIDSYFYYYMQQTYGLDQLAQKYTEIFINSIMVHRKADARVFIFSQFIGVDQNVILSFQIFEKFITMIKAIGQGIFNLFHLPLNIMFVDYQRVRFTFKQLLGEYADFQTYKYIYKKIKSVVIINSNNKFLQKNLKLEEYEVWRDMNEQIVSSKYCRLTNFLNEMFKNFGIYEDNLDES